MHEKIADIQNSFWKAYKDLLQTKDMRKCNADIDEILERYKSDGMMLNFCNSLLVAWCPVLNRIKEQL